LVVRGRQYDFFCLLTDVCLGTSSDRILVNPPHPEDDFLLDVLSGSGTYGTVNLSPMLMLNKFSQIPPMLDEGASLKAKGKKAKAESGKAVLASFEAHGSYSQSKRFRATSVRYLMPMRTTFDRYLVGKMTRHGRISRSVNH
jgi:uncharacterized protein